MVMVVGVVTDFEMTYSQTSEARTWESSNTTENSNKNLGPDKKMLLIQ